MLFTLLGLMVIIISGVSGYFRGVLRIFASFLALFLAALLAGPLSFLFSGAVGNWKAVPLSLEPGATFLLSAFIVFFIAGALCEVFLSLREKKLKEKNLPVRGKIEAYTGAALGTLWGLFVVILIFTSIEIIGTVDMGMNKAMAQINHMRTLREIYSQDNTINPVQEFPFQNTPGPDVTPVPVPTPQESRFGDIKEEVDSSIFSPVVTYVNPVDDKTLQVFEDLLIVTGDPELFARFQSHPVIAGLAKNPGILALAEDEDIQYYIQNQQYGELLDNQKISELLNDRDLFEELRDVDMQQILTEVMNE